ncbi:unnamed protein product [Didymodactylos carnosus]|uniref:Uncharacterized protein n=1 Tax=Didymodactylos carnosus TaxID=1234261 RepID=A0A813XZE6_9BILA|nr:unnamed protein product [Didymodactylos carnosus]CAF3663919.1 unnamed protein product [Didymodactylos carnosus]
MHVVNNLKIPTIGTYTLAPKCSECETNEANAILIPCGHLLYCTRCAPSIHVCTKRHEKESDKTVTNWAAVFNVFNN